MLIGGSLKSGVWLSQNVQSSKSSMSRNYLRSCEHQRSSMLWRKVTEVWCISFLKESFRFEFCNLGTRTGRDAFAKERPQPDIGSGSATRLSCNMQGVPKLYVPLNLGLLIYRAPKSRKQKDPTKQHFWYPPLYLALEPECEIRFYGPGLLLKRLTCLLQGSSWG